MMMMMMVMIMVTMMMMMVKQQAHAPSAVYNKQTWHCSQSDGRRRQHPVTEEANTKLHQKSF